MRKVSLNRTILGIILLLIPFKVLSQQELIPYINAGYITNFRKNPDNLKADRGGSVRIGIFKTGPGANGRLGFYAGFLWFNEYHPATLGYEDSGKMLIAGIDYLLFGMNDLKLYASLGLGNEWFISEYSNNIREVETSVKPDFGILISFKWLNAFMGWQPSDPHHLNIGVGFSIFKYD